MGCKIEYNDDDCKDGIKLEPGQDECIDLNRTNLIYEENSNDTKSSADFLSEDEDDFFAFATRSVILNSNINPCDDSINDEIKQELDQTDNQPTEIMDFGKYRGKPYKWVRRYRPDYCKWALRQRSSLTRLGKFKIWLIEQRINAESVNTRQINSDSSIMMDFGKYRGKPYIWVHRYKPDYCIWALKQQNCSFRLKKFQIWLFIFSAEKRLRDNDNTSRNRLIDFGRFKGNTYGWVCRNEPEYCIWALRQSNPAICLANFQNWLWRMTLVDARDDSLF